MMTTEKNKNMKLLTSVITFVIFNNAITVLPVVIPNGGI
jgi:hypothetical protein